MADPSTLTGLVRKILVLVLGMVVGLLYSPCASGVAWAVWPGYLGCIHQQQAFLDFELACKTGDCSASSLTLILV